MEKRVTKGKYITIAAILLICGLLVTLLSRKVPGLDKTKDMLPRLGQEPVYVEMTEGETLSVSYTPSEDMTVRSLKILLVNTGNGVGSDLEAPYLKAFLYGADKDKLWEDSISMADIEAGSWYSLYAPFDLSGDITYTFEFLPVGCDPYFMKVSGYEPGISLGFEVVTSPEVTYGDIFYFSIPLVILAGIIAIGYILAGERIRKTAEALKENKAAFLVFNILFLVLLFITLSVKILKTAYIDGVYISADSDGYMREAVNLVAGNGFSYEGIAGYQSHFANWPIIYPLMIAAVMIVTGANAYLAGKIVAILTIAVIFAVLFVEFKEKAWGYALSFTNAGFLGLCYYTWSEVPFILFMMLFALTFAKIISENDPKAKSFVFLTLWGSLAFLTRYFGLFLWMVAGVYWLFLVIKQLREVGFRKSLFTRKITGLFFSGVSFGVIGCGYLMMNKIFNGYPTGVSRGTWWDDYASLTRDLVNSIIVEIFNVFSLEVPQLLNELGPAMSVWFIVLVAALMAYSITKCKKKDVRAMSIIIISAAYYVIFTLVRYRSSMDTFYYRFFAPATVLLVMGLICLIRENGLLSPGFVRVIAVFSLMFTAINCASYVKEIPDWNNGPTAFDVVKSDWDQMYSEIPQKSVMIWSDLDYRSTWYRPDVYNGELYEGDTWESLAERYYASDYVVIKKEDAQALVESGNYDDTVSKKIEDAMNSSSTGKYLILQKK